MDTVSSVNTRFAINLEATDFPFGCELSLALLVRFWQQHILYSPSGKGCFVTRLHEALQAAHMRRRLRVPFEATH